MKVTRVLVGSSDYDLAVHASTSAKSPVFVHVNQRGNASMGCYVYTIGTPLKSSVDSTYSVVLQGDGSGLQDLAANLGRVLAKKFGCPAYVSMSGSVSLTDYAFLSQEVVRACQ